LSHLSTSFWMPDAKNNAGCCPSHCQTTDCTSVSDGTKCLNELGRYVEKRNTRVIAFNDVILMWLLRIWLSFVCWVLSYDSKLMEKNSTQIDCILLSDDVTIMTSSLRKVVCMFTIKFPTKRIFQIFPILRTDGMAPFGTYLWNDPRIRQDNTGQNMTGQIQRSAAIKIWNNTLQ